MKQKLILWLLSHLDLSKVDLPQKVYWVSADVSPDDDREVLCELEQYSSVPFIPKSIDYCKGQWDSYTKVFYTTKGGSYKVLNCVRWMEIK